MSLEILVRTAQYFGRVGPSVAGAKELQYVHHCAHDVIRAALAAERDAERARCAKIVRENFVVEVPTFNERNAMDDMITKITEPRNAE